MARLGMDADQVAAAGKSLKERAAEIDGLVAKIDGIVRSLPGVWDGPDAQQFTNEWWPEHKKTLVAASSHVAGLGQSALNNAAEQRDVSQGSNSGGGSGTGTGGSGNGEAPPMASTMPVPVEGARPGEKFTAWAGGAVGRAIDVDKAYGNQCVDVINDYAESLYPGVGHGASLGGGNAQDIYGNASAQYFDKVPSASGPQPGDIICIGANQYSSVGHVAVVESVENGVVHVIQQNGANPSGSTYRGTVSAIEMAAVQGYLRPKAA